MFLCTWVCALVLWHMFEDNLQPSVLVYYVGFVDQAHVECQKEILPLSSHTNPREIQS